MTVTEDEWPEAGCPKWLSTDLGIWPSSFNSGLLSSIETHIHKDFSCNYRNENRSFLE